jgi:3-deoxy-D-manno-octulosonic-acid transferase
MFVYNIVIHLYGFIIRVAALRKKKAKQWINGRKNWRQNLGKKISELKSEKIIWVHCASYGEFEQGRPLIDAIKKNHADYKIVLSFFSPSGYEHFKNWEGADVVCYLPLDTKKNARDYVEIIRPKMVFFIKYEFWLNFLSELKLHGIPTYLISAVFKPHHPFFKWYGSIFRKSLSTFKTLFIQDERSGKLLNRIGIKNHEVFGDTRFDRVLQVKENFKEIEAIKSFKGNNKLLVAGSVWMKDTELILQALSAVNRDNLKVVIVPHEVDEKSINEIISLLQHYGLKYQFYSVLEPLVQQVLIVDVIGLLSNIYFYADCAYIGGGFNGGLHNCLEPAVFETPIVFFGMNHEKYNEALDLIKLQAAKPIYSAQELEVALNGFLFEYYNKIEFSNKLETYFNNNSNVSNKLLQRINLS